MGSVNRSKTYVRLELFAIKTDFQLLYTLHSLYLAWISIYLFRVFAIVVHFTSPPADHLKIDFFLTWIIIAVDNTAALVHNRVHTWFAFDSSIWSLINFCLNIPRKTVLIDCHRAVYERKLYDKGYADINLCRRDDCVCLEQNGGKKNVFLALLAIAYLFLLPRHFRAD